MTCTGQCSACDGSKAALTTTTTYDGFGNAQSGITLSLAIGQPPPSEKCSTKDRPEYTKPLRLCGVYMRTNDCPPAGCGCYDCPPTTMCEDVDKCDFEEAHNIPSSCCE